MDNRDAALKAIYRDFPDVPQAWAEMVYDFCVKHEGTKEMEELIAKVESGRLAPKPRDTAGEYLSSVEILSTE
jgi:hypothetical protein